jgi:hypothetical protein
MMRAKKSIERQSKQSIKIPLDFKNTVLAALETKPEPRKKGHQKPKPAEKGGLGEDGS